jgi:hypothetical protein
VEEMKKSLLIAFIAMSLVLFTSVGVAFAGKPSGGGGVTMQQVNEAIDAAKAEMRAYTDGAVMVLTSQISDLYGQISGFGYEIGSLWNQVTYLDEFTQSQDGNIQNLYSQLSNLDNMVQITQGEVAGLYSIVGGMNSAINDLTFRVNNIEGTLSWVTDRLYQMPYNQNYPAPDDLAMGVDAAYIDGNTLHMNNFRLTDFGPGHPDADVDADFWFVFDGKNVDPNWSFSFYPAKGATAVTHSLQYTLTTDQTITVHTYAFYGGRTWSFTNNISGNTPPVTP